MNATFVVLTKVAAALPVKTRLWRALGRTGAEELYAWMLAETVARLQRYGSPIVAYSPPEAAPATAFPWLEGCDFLPTPGRDGAQCLEYAVHAVYTGVPVVVLGGDAPDLPLSRISDVVSSLAMNDAAVVPSLDGGFSCLGLREPIPGLAGAFTFGDGGALGSLQRFLAAEARVSVALEPWPDVDTPEDVDALLRRLATPPTDLPLAAAG